MNCSTARPPPSFSLYNNLTVVVCYGLVFAIAFIGNVGMFMILCRNHYVKRRRVHSLLLHMTIAHLLVTLIYIPKEIVHNITVAWLGGDLLCRLCKFFDVFGVALSAMILVCLSLDRFYSILYPLYVINAKRSVQRMLTTAWIVSFASSLPQIYIFRTATHPCFPEFSQCVSGDVVQAFSPRITFWFSVWNILQVYFFPLLAILVCYGSILISISLKSKSVSTKASPPEGHRRKSMVGKACSAASLLVERHKNGATVVKSTTLLGGQRMASSATDDDGGLRRNGSDSYEKAKNRTLKMTIVLVLAFLLCWTPYTVAMFFHFLKASSGQRPISPLLSKFLYAFAVFNSAISPYLYGYFSFNMKDECRRMSHFFLRVTNRLTASCSAEESLTAMSVRSRGPMPSVASTTESIFAGGAGSAISGSRMRRAAQSEYHRFPRVPANSCLATVNGNAATVCAASQHTKPATIGVRFNTPPVAHRSRGKLAPDAARQQWGAVRSPSYDGHERSGSSFDTPSSAASPEAETAQPPASSIDDPSDNRGESSRALKS